VPLSSSELFFSLPCMKMMRSYDEMILMNAFDVYQWKWMHLHRYGKVCQFQILEVDEDRRSRQLSLNTRADELLLLR
jgi:hypothetical protein